MSHQLLAQVLIGAPALRHFGYLSVGSDGVPVRAASLDLTTRKRAVYFKSTSMYRDVFNKIYTNKIWSDAGGGSGPGSTLEYTAVVRAALPKILLRLGIKSMIDTSCGSMAWMPQVLEEVQRSTPGFKFHGSDVVCSLVDGHRTTFASHPNWSFSCLDYANERLPSGYDLVWSRDSLQHVPLHAAWQFLNNVRASGAQYLLVGSYITSTEPNTDIRAGQYYPINLAAHPFNLRPAPLEVVDERSADAKYMLLYDLRTLEWDDPLEGLL